MVSGPRYISVAVLLGLFACGEDDEGLLPTDPNLNDVQEMVFEQACATSGCHDSAAAGGLDLSSNEQSRANLIGVAPTNRLARASGWSRIVPGAVDDSFLYRKITLPGLGEGAPMPVSNQLTEPYIALVRRWIEGGAR